PRKDDLYHPPEDQPHQHQHDGKVGKEQGDHQTARRRKRRQSRKQHIGEGAKADRQNDEADRQGRGKMLPAQETPESAFPSRGPVLPGFFHLICRYHACSCAAAKMQKESRNPSRTAHPVPKAPRSSFGPCVFCNSRRYRSTTMLRVYITRAGCGRRRKAVSSLTSGRG